MKVLIAAVGRAKSREVRVLLDDYYSRIRRYAQLEELELDDTRADKLQDQVQRVLHGLKGRGELVALEVKGKSFSSEAFASKLGQRLECAMVPVFLIGGAEGIPEDLSSRAAWTLTLSPMTLPHRLARVIVAEQIYRAFTILRGEPYAREG
jgi:23S rRNA (pseudouridine1915-N3)-methyltransferase